MLSERLRGGEPGTARVSGRGIGYRDGRVRRKYFGRLAHNHLDGLASGDAAAQLPILPFSVRFFLA